MSLPGALLLLAVLLSLCAVGVMAAGVASQGKALWRSTQALQKQIAPTVADISAGGVEAQATAARIQERMKELEEATASLRGSR